MGIRKFIVCYMVSVTLSKCFLVDMVVHSDLV